MQSSQLYWGSLDALDTLVQWERGVEFNDLNHRPSSHERSGRPKSPCQPQGGKRRRRNGRLGLSRKSVATHNGNVVEKIGCMLETPHVSWWYSSTVGTLSTVVSENPQAKRTISREVLSAPVSRPDSMTPQRLHADSPIRNNCWG